METPLLRAAVILTHDPSLALGAETAPRGLRAHLRLGPPGLRHRRIRHPSSDLRPAPFLHGSLEGHRLIDVGAERSHQVCGRSLPIAKNASFDSFAAARTLLSLPTRANRRQSTALRVRQLHECMARDMLPTSQKLTLAHGRGAWAGAPWTNGRDQGGQP